MAQFIAFLFSLLLCTQAFASPPSRAYVYVAGDPILSSEVSANEDSIFNYLQQGVDNIYDGSVINADINASANIAASKLNLTSIAQNITNTGTFTNSGNLTVSGGGTIDGIGVVPIGGIIMWSGAIVDIPTAWELSDGTCAIACPDLRDKFVMGAGSTYAVDATGGAATLNLAHTHTVSRDGWGETFPGYQAGRLLTRADNPGTAANGITTGSTGGAAESILNPYYSLAYIIRVQ